MIINAELQERLYTVATQQGVSVDDLLELFLNLFVTDRFFVSDFQDAVQSLFNLSTDMLCSIGMDGYFRIINPAFPATLGYTTEEILSTHYLEFVCPEDREKAAIEFEKLRLGLPTNSFEHQCICKNGELKWLSWTSTPFKDDGLIYGVARDITHRKAMEDALRAANDQLETRVIERTMQLEATNHQLQQEIQERKAVEEALRESEARFAGIVHLQADGIVTIDEDYCIILFNQAAEKMYGYTADEVIGKCFTLLAPEAFREQHLNALASFIKSSEDVRMVKDKQVYGLHKDGTQFPADVSICKVPDQGRLVYTISVRDITEQLRIEADLLANLKREKELNEMKTKFISMASHEFRTPMSIILSSSEMLRHYSDRMSETRRLEHLDKIKGYIQHMNRLVDTALCVSREEVKGLSFTPVPCNLESLCHEILDELHPVLGETHQIILTSSVSCPLILLDRNLIYLMLTNLLTNAVKYSPEADQVHLRLRCDPSEVIIEIQDYGIGIPEVDRSRLFETFYRGSNVGAIAGTGLGMTVIYQAVHAHQGRIELVSDVGSGTTFTIYLPISI